ncbi:MULTISPECIES: hypothetical protein [unclassified Sinorhizobium]|uniref:hypothetical protein n=1 Tax=unclassified Sinorhizobium TaxID=2613772 RepID=UPI003525289E
MKKITETVYLDAEKADGMTIEQFCEYIRSFENAGENVRIHAISDYEGSEFGFQFERDETEEEEQMREAYENRKAERARRYKEFCDAGFAYELKRNS